MSIQRYKYCSLSPENLKRYTKSGGTIANQTMFLVDIDLNDDADKADLDEYMTSIGYVFVESKPQTPLL